jgi:alpha-galactosidase
MENPEIFSRDTVRFEVMKQFGYFVTESTRHMSEYTPYFRTNEDSIEDFNLNQIRQDLQRRTTRVDDHYTQLLEDANTDRVLTADRSEEYACRIIEAMESDRPTVINGNVPNEGLIDNLLDLSSVEVPILIDKLGFHPMSVGELPGQLAALSRSNQAVQQMATQAILDGDREAAFHAIALDPLTSAVLSLGEIRSMFDEMWTAHGNELAAYS